MTHIKTHIVEIDPHDVTINFGSIIKDTFTLFLNQTFKF